VSANAGFIRIGLSAVAAVTAIQRIFFMGGSSVAETGRPLARCANARGLSAEKWHGLHL
jgi:hypothetical protein